MAKTANTLAPMSLLFSDMQAGIEDKAPDSIDEIVTRVAGYFPALTFQTVVRFKDRTLPWATAVGEDAFATQQKALALALRGREAVVKESTALFHQNKNMATDVMNNLLQDNANILVSGSVEMQPSQGWVAVVFHRPGVDERDLAKFAGLAEVREIEDSNKPPRPDRNRRRAPAEPAAAPEDEAKPARSLPPRKGRRATTAEDLEENSKAKANEESWDRKKPRKPTPATPVSAGDVNLEEMRTWKKSALIKFHQEKFGKQPNNKLTPDEIVDLIASKLEG